VPWSPELLAADGRLTTPGPGIPDPVPFYRGVQELAPLALLASWAGEPHLYDPRVGAVSGAGFADYLRTTREWLALGDATVRQVSLLTTEFRSVEEVVLELTVGGERQQLPVAVVAEHDSEHRLTAVRIYHSLWPLFSNHHAHTPLIEPGPAVVLPDFLQRNHEARAAGDLAAVLESYEDDAVVQTTTGGVHSFHGRDEIRRLFSVPSIPGVKPVVQLCAVTDDGRSCAVEYRVVTHLSEPEPDQFGVTVHTRGRSGRIATERDYLVCCPSAPSGSISTDPLGAGATPPARLALVPRENPALEVSRER
jgi:hypothetical protein